MHVQRYVDDAIELAEYLRKRYGKRKLVLMAHSWGTVVGDAARRCSGRTCSMPMSASAR